jgi:flagellar motor switch protein FliN/FliY
MPEESKEKGQKQDPESKETASDSEKIEERIRSLDLIVDIPLKVSVELGRSRILVKDLLRLGQGSVIELTKTAGEPLDVLVNDKPIARGEVVVVNEKFGIRITEILSPKERVEHLG